MLRQRERIDRAGTAVVVVHDSAERVRSGFLRDLEVPYPVLIDAELRSYGGWGLGRASAARALLSPRVALGYARRMLGGERLTTPGSEPLQLGGDFVVDGAGALTYAHPQSDVDDRPPVALLVRELEAAAQTATTRSSADH